MRSGSYPAGTAPKLQAPYQLINTALNIQGSDFANRRGRNADFFMFSALNVGSEATGYAATPLLQDDEQSLDLANVLVGNGLLPSRRQKAVGMRRFRDPAQVEVDVTVLDDDGPNERKILFHGQRPLGQLVHRGLADERVQLSQARCFKSRR